MDKDFLTRKIIAIESKKSYKDTVYLSHPIYLSNDELANFDLSKMWPKATIKDAWGIPWAGIFWYEPENALYCIEKFDIRKVEPIKAIEIDSVTYQAYDDNGNPVNEFELSSLVESDYFVQTDDGRMFVHFVFV